MSKIDIMAADIPFRSAFKHAARERVSSESVFVRLEAESGIAGFGESLPRRYVTGEGQKSVTTLLKKVLPQLLLGRTFSSFEEAAAFAGSSSALKGAAKCVFELALLDCMGKAFHCSVGRALGEVKAKRVRYSGVIGKDSAGATGAAALKLRLYGMRDIKIKVGDDGDVKRLTTARSFLGRGRDIRLDANGAWSAGQAIEKLSIMRESGFSAIEQPVEKGNVEALKKVADAVPEPVMADESLCDIEDARELVRQRACDMFNIRISKCGGLLDSLKIAEFAGQSGISCAVGCQVGETGILSAAARHFASCVSGMRYLEGSYAKFLLIDDIVREDISFGYGGFAAPIAGTGLGVTVNERVLNKYVTDRATIE